ncbi:fructose-6-phosphate aldolase [bacterium]|nr:fructose-6-phosphate aldolase [bacterium]
MQIFLDTANLDEIRQGVAMGVVDGVTTNPSLVAKEQCKFKDRVLEICDVVQGPVSAEVVATDYEGMLSQGREIAAWHKHVVVKIPLIPAGIAAIRTLSAEGIRTNCTLCFSLNQAWLAAKAGATYISPFVGRLDDIGNNGMALIEEIRAAYDNYGFETKLLAASLRHPEHVRQCLLAGADVGTLPFGVLKSLFSHPLTDKGLKAFLDDWEKVKDLV